jgi:hypothetical protein
MHKNEKEAFGNNSVICWWKHMKIKLESSNKLIILILFTGRMEEKKEKRFGFTIKVLSAKDLFDVADKQSEYYFNRFNQIETQ